MQLVIKKRQIIPPKMVLKGKTVGKAAPQQKPPKKKIGQVIYGSGKVNLLDIIRSAANAADLEAAYEQMDIKAKGLLRAIYTAASGTEQAAGKFGLVPTPILDANGKGTGKEEVAVGFGEVIEKNGSLGYRIFIKAEISGNEALLWIEACDSRFEYFSEFQTLEQHMFSKVRFFAGPSSSDRRHVYVQFPLVAVSKGKAPHINQLVALAINSAK